MIATRLGLPTVPVGRTSSFANRQTALAPVRRGRQQLRVQAAGEIVPQIAAQAGQAATDLSAQPGSVNAPAWVIPVAAIIVTVVLSASSFLLKPGTDAAPKVFARDAKRLASAAKKEAARAKSAVKR